MLISQSRLTEMLACPHAGCVPTLPLSAAIPPRWTAPGAAGPRWRPERPWPTVATGGQVPKYRDGGEGTVDQAGGGTGKVK
jgi:hypothetical protein